ncbi:MAG: hypothetical protein JNL42_03790, partial [Anaerolineae bacterium]|nr:hypothetical protein [Anaerolineae bacterium]
MLNSSQSLYSLLLVLIAVAVALFAYTRWRLREIRATAGTGSLLLGCGSLWILANAFELASRDLNTALRWFCIEHVAMTPIPILWLLLAFQFTGKEALLTRGRFAAMTLVPIVCIAILLSDAFRAQFVAAARLELSDSGANLVVEPGAFMVAYYGYGYVLVIAGAILVSRKLIRSLGFVWQGTIALTGVTLTLLANILDWTQLNPIPFVKLTPLALVTAVVLFIVTL